MRILPHFLRCLAPLFIILLLSSCAGQAPPSGGPPDTEPPKIASVYPQPLSLNFRDSKIVLEFDEHVDHRSVEGSIFVSPSLGRLEFDWSGTEVEISFTDPLRPNTTYVVNVGTDVIDLRNKNRMASAFSLAFSTGNSIDPGTIMGRVYPSSLSDQLSGITVFAYALDHVDPDTLDASKSTPDYATQTGKSGEFYLPHLALGSYRLFAVRDEYKNLLYDPETDEFAAASETVQVTADDTLRTDVIMRLAREDTTSPRLIKVTPLNRRLLLAEASEPVDTSSLGTANVLVTDTLERRHLRIISVAARLPLRKEFFVLTEEQEPGLPYELRLRGTKDLSGKEVNASASSIEFMSSDSSDTSPPAVESFSVADSGRGVEVRPTLEIRFTEPVQRVGWQGIAELRDSLGGSVVLDGGWANDAAIVVRPAAHLMGRSWYKLAVRTGMLRDWNGREGADTMRVVWFQTLDPERLSSVTGQVSDSRKDDAVGPVVVTAWPVGKKDAVPKSVVVEEPGPFELRELAEGQYVIHAYRDRNRNNKFDAGRVFPFVLSERFSIFPDTLKLRARWPLENVRVQLK